MRQPVIDLVYFNAGGGHRAAALALQQAIAEQKQQMAQVDNERMTEVTRDLRDTQGKLLEVIPKLVNARAVLGRIEIRSPYTGRIVGLDNRVDLALVKIDAVDLPSLPLGDSNALRVGEFVLALGHPFGLEQSVSFGIVSRKGAPPSMEIV